MTTIQDKPESVLKENEDSQDMEANDAEEGLESVSSASFTFTRSPAPTLSNPSSPVSQEETSSDVEESDGASKIKKMKTEKTKNFTSFMATTSTRGTINYKESQVRQEPRWSMIKVFPEICVEVNLARYLSIFRALCIPIGSGTMSKIKFEQNLFSTPIVTFKQQNDNETILLYHARKSKYFLVFGKSFEDVQRLFDMTLIKDLEETILRTEDGPILETPMGQLTWNQCT